MSSGQTNMQLANSSYDIVQRYKRQCEVSLEESVKFYEGLRLNRVYIFLKKYVNSLGIEDVRRHYLLIKKKWWRYEYWSDDRIPSCADLTGTTIPEDLYTYLYTKRSNDDTAKIVLYMTEDQLFYIADWIAIKEFVKKKSSFFTDKYNNRVVGLVSDLFSCHGDAFK